MSLQSTRRSFIGIMLAGTAGVLQAQKLTRQGAPQDQSVRPERILLNLTLNPAHEQIVTWRTARVLSSASVQVAEATAHPDFEKGARTIAAEITRFETPEGKTVGQYSARMQNLKPDTRYCYRAGDGTAWSEWLEFRTASAAPDTFRFLYLGDAQNNIRSLCSRAMRAAYAAAPDARFAVHAGDLVAEGYDDNLWGEWFDALGSLGSSISNMPVPGNHDMHRAPGVEVILDSPAIWRAQFSLPQNGPAGVPELNQHSYYVDYQGVRMISLDVNVYANESFSAADKQRIGEAQLAWLQQVLSNNPNPWVIVVQHQPVYTVSKERDYAEMRSRLVPLYDKYGVALVLQGHDHAYARTYPLKSGKIAASGEGTVYAISVAGPKMYTDGGNFDLLMAKQLRHTQMYQVIEVSKEAILYSAFDIEGMLVDEVRIQSRLRRTVMD